MLPFVSDIREYFINELKYERFVTDKSGVRMVELAGASFHADEPLIFGAINEDYVRREIEWYKSQSLSVYDIPEPVPAIWKQVADKNGLIHSNYGYLIFSRENGSQYERCLAELVKNRESRRAVMIYTRPSIQVEYCRDGMSDFICTNAVQYLIRNKGLHAIVQMRSNDVVFGYRNDFAWQKLVLTELTREFNNQVCADEKVAIGDIIWNAGSLHVYERHFPLIK